MAGRERQRGINWAPSLENDPNINPALIYGLDYAIADGMFTRNFH